MEDILGVAWEFKPLVSDVMSLMRGNVFAIKDLFTDVTGIVSAAKKAFTTCTASIFLAAIDKVVNPDDFNVNCFSDVADIAKAGYAFAEACKTLVEKKDISVLDEMLQDIETIVAKAKDAKNDC
jgi:hypothetical protein